LIDALAKLFACEMESPIQVVVHVDSKHIISRRLGEVATSNVGLWSCPIELLVVTLIFKIRTDVCIIV
jgi:hypothetical protein